MEGGDSFLFPPKSFFLSMPFVRVPEKQQTTAHSTQHTAHSTPNCSNINKTKSAAATNTQVQYLQFTIMGDSAYSFSLTTFSRTGKLLQIEYALNAVANGRTSLGICAKDGVVIATDKKLSSSLVDTDDVNKVQGVNDNCGFVYSGLGPDYRVLGESTPGRMVL